MSEINAILRALISVDEPAVLATLVNVEGSSYRRPGARMLLLDKGMRIGSISGGCLEEDVVERSRGVISSGRPELAIYDTTIENDTVWGVGLGCQGVARVLLEPIMEERPQWIMRLAENMNLLRGTALASVYEGLSQEEWGTRLDSELPGSIGNRGVFRQLISPDPHLVICGAGDDARPLARMASETGWRVTVVDSRPAFATRDRFPEATAVMAVSANEMSARVGLDENTFVAILTHRFSDDRELLRSLAGRRLSYLGVLGPRKRTERLLAELQAEGVALHTSFHDTLYSPIGLDLGGSTPAAVALSILAEMHCRLSSHLPMHLRYRLGSIHE